MGNYYLNKNCKFEYSYFFWTILIGYMKLISEDIENLREKILSFVLNRFIKIIL